MAKILNTPKEFPFEKPDMENYDYRKEQAREDAYVAKLKEWARARYVGDMVGEVIRTHVADGFAQYMIACYRPFALIHLPFGDCYRASPIWERGCKLQDAKELVERERAMQKFFAERSQE